MVRRSVCAVVVLCAVVSIYWFNAQASRYMYPDVFAVLPVIHDDVFASDDLPARAETARLSVSAVENGAKTVFAETITTGRGYFEMCFMNFKSGGIWRDEFSIIICENLAWQLFGGTNAVGLTAAIDGTPYTITGVAEATDSGVYAWLPRTNEAERASILLVKPENYNRVGSRIETENLLKSQNLHPRDFSITDINAYTESIKLRGNLLLFAAVLVFVAATTRNALRAKSLTQGVFVFVGNFIALVVLFNTASLDLWLPAFYPEGFGGYAQLIFNSNLLAPPRYLHSQLNALYKINTYANIAFAIGFFALLFALPGCKKNN
ncbi:MAG: ABC transporter permease [Clostridiales bacterium]|jgi:hypothetical protein|nr:ABC transporter permease [Clostridiales bacterium]